MPQINVTVDDVSPLITYGPSGAWQGAESPFYLDSTYTIADVSGATASFSFYGSAIWIFAAKGTTSPVYNVTLDGATSSFNGIVDSPVYQTPIFNATDLTLGNHHVTLTNAPVTGNGSDPLLTLDYIVWQTEIGQASDTLKHTVIEDTDPAFDYQPENAWYSINSMNESYHGTGRADGYVTLAFSGEHIELFGFVGPEWSNYSVQLDNGDPIVHSAYRAASSEPALLFFATNLSTGNHSLKIANVPTDIPINSHSTSIDYANISWTVSSAPSANTTVSGSSRKHGLSAGIIAAIAVSTAIALLIFIAVFIILRRRRKGEGVTDDVGKQRITEPSHVQSSVPPVEQSQHSSLPITPLASPQDFKLRSVSAGGGLPSGIPEGSSSPVSTSTSRPLPKSSVPIPSGSQVVSDSALSPAQAPDTAEGHRDAGVSLGGDQLPPPDYKEATRHWSS